MLMYVRFVVIFHWTADKKELNELGDKKTVIENTDYSLPPTPPPPPPLLHGTVRYPLSLSGNECIAFLFHLLIVNTEGRC